MVWTEGDGIHACWCPIQSSYMSFTVHCSLRSHVCTIPYIQEWLSISLHHNHKLWFVVNSINLYPILLSPVQWPMGSLGQALCAIHPKHTESLSQAIIWAFVYSLWMIFEWRGFSKLWRVVDGRESLIVRRIVLIHIILSFVTAYCHHLN